MKAMIDEGIEIDGQFDEGIDGGNSILSIDGAIYSLTGNNHIYSSYPCCGK